MAGTSTTPWSRVRTASTTTATRSACDRGVGSVERARREPRRQSDEGIEDRLAHQQPRVGEPRQAERERCGGERPALRHQPAAPGEDGHGRERHHEGLEDAGDVVADRRVEERERQADQRGVEEAVERRVLRRGCRGGPTPRGFGRAPRRSSRRRRSTAWGRAGPRPHARSSRPRPARPGPPRPEPASRPP